MFMVFYLSRLELRRLPIKHIHRLDATVQHSDGPVEHAHEVAARQEEPQKRTKQKFVLIFIKLHSLKVKKRYTHYNTMQIH